MLPVGGLPFSPGAPMATLLAPSASCGKAGLYSKCCHFKTTPLPELHVWRTVPYSSGCHFSTSFLKVLSAEGLPLSPGAPMATLLQVLPVGRLAFALNVAILRQLLSQSSMFGGLYLTLDSATFRTSFLQVLPVAGLPFNPGAPMATLLQVLPVGRLAFILNVIILRQLFSQSFMFGGLHLTLNPHQNDQG
jgi:hypothetical protein